MAVWTISSDEGSGGDEVARALAARVGVPLLDAETIASAVRSEMGAEGRVGRRVASWLCDCVLSIPPVFGLVPPASRRELTERLILEAARSSCVVAYCTAFAVLAEHPGACHVRIRAPFDWRVRRHARENCLSRETSRKLLLRVDRKRAAYVRRVYGNRLNRFESFTVVCDSSRFGLDDLIDVLLIAGGASERANSQNAMVVGGLTKWQLGAPLL